MNTPAQAALVGGQAGGQIVPATLTERLDAERVQLEKRLKQINEALGELRANPESQRLLDSIAKLGHLGY